MSTRCPTCRRYAPPLGALVVDELIVPVTDLYLSDRAFCAVADIAGPVRAVDTTDYVLCDRSGGTVYRTAGRNRLAWPRMEQGAQIRIMTDLRITDVV